jgi:2-iminobutanoate/2-iminopropanoate deaminase
MKSIHSPAAPAAIGPYAHAIAAGPFVFCSGQTSLDPATGKLIEGDIEAHTQRTLDNLALVLAAAGLTLRDVVKTTVFLKDMADFARMNAVYATAFAPHKPARSTIQVAKNPLDARIEIECIACQAPA